MKLEKSLIITIISVFILGVVSDFGISSFQR